MPSVASWGILDYSNERSGFKVYVPDVTSANYDAMVTALGAMNVAVAAITTGNIVSQSVSIDTGIAGAPVLPTDPNAQRELGLKFFYSDNVSGAKGNFTVPCPDLAVVSQQGTDNVDLTLSVVAAVVTAFENFFVSREGNAITITSGKIVGRRN